MPELSYCNCRRLSRWLSGKESACQCRRHKKGGSIPGWGRNAGVRNGNPLQVTWNVPWTVEPDGLQSMGLQRVGHDYYCIKVVMLEDFSLT